MFQKIAFISLVASLVACESWDHRRDVSPEPAEEKSASEKPDYLGELKPKSGDFEDQDFVRQAASGGMFEVKSSSYALDRGEPLGAMEGFAKKMVEDHEKANVHLAELAKKKGWQMPAELLPEERQLMSKLGHAGTNLEKVYRQVQKKAHEKAIQDFEKCLDKCEDAELVGFAKRTSKVIREHRELLEGLSQRAQR